VSDSTTYSAFGQVATYAAEENGDSVYSVVYDTPDQLGRIARKTETIAGSTTVYEYRYDAAGRLDQVKHDSQMTATYTYDANGNRLSHTTPGGTTIGAYDPQDRLTSYGTASYTYTPNGELASKTVGSEVTTYTYDALGNLRAVTSTSGSTIEYLVDGRNRRIGKKVNGTFVGGMLYDGQLNPVAQLGPTGGVVAQFVYGSRLNVPDYMTRHDEQTGQPTGTYRIISDHLGSPRLVVNVADGLVAQRLDYDEFGNVLTDTNPGLQPFGFAGGLYDSDTKLVRFGARDYDAQTARWTAKDPIRFAGGGSNLYGYVLGDPINYIDPSGLQSGTGSLVLDCISGFPSSETHANRNRYNRCPAQRPQPGPADCENRVWWYDDFGQGKFRADDGSECVYSDSGNLIPNAGTFNFQPFGTYGFNAEVFLHICSDVAPHFYYGGQSVYIPDLTQTYQCLCPE